jgi:hypothetical protein
MKEENVPNGWTIRVILPTLVAAAVLSLFASMPASADKSKPKPKPKESMGNFQIQDLMSTYNQSESKKKGSTKKAK